MARRAGPPGTPGSPPRRLAWAAALVVAAAVAVLLVALLGRIHAGSPRATGGGATPPVAPGAARVALKPGGRWIIPSAEGYVIRGDTFRLSAHAYPTNQGDPPIAHVSFTANWLGPAGGWRVLCQVTAPRAGTDEYDCTLDLARDRAPNGPINLSFDVFDVEGNVNEAPNGTRHGRVER